MAHVRFDGLYTHAALIGCLMAAKAKCSNPGIRLPGPCVDVLFVGGYGEDQFAFCRVQGVTACAGKTVVSSVRQNTGRQDKACEHR